MSKKYLLTTSDYPPKLGGLSTFTKNLERSLDRTGIEFDVFHWQKYSDFKDYCFDRYDRVIHVHPWGSVYQAFYNKIAVPFVNFYHGSETLFRGRGALRTGFKKLIKPLVLKNFESSCRNIFISEFTFHKLVENGLKPNYARDVIFHNTIDQASAEFIDLSINQELSFICVARDVPHKNLEGCVELCEEIKKAYPMFQVSLFITSPKYTSEIIDLVDISNLSDFEIQAYYQKAHFNLLLSHDHSDKGYYEGFGLTCLEAANYGVPSIVSRFGGLPENVHDDYNGFVVSESQESCVARLRDYLVPEIYSDLRKATFHHNRLSHGEMALDRIWGLI